MFAIRHFRSVLLATLLIQGLSSGLAPAQSTPLWDRKVEGIIVRPILDGGGKRFEIRPMVRVSAQPTTVPLDLSTLVEVVVNGATVDVIELSIQADPTGAAGCQVPCHEQGKVCVCVQGGTCGCETILVSEPVVAATLSAGDEIVVILHPAPDARPEPSPKNDRKSIVWNGRPTVWERKLASIEKKPGTTPGATDVHVDVGAITNHDGTLDLDTKLELRINGKHSASGIADFDDYTWSSCAGGCSGAVCAALNGGDAGAACQKDPEVGEDTCWCNFPSLGTFVFTNVKLSPDDEIEVLLSPAAGSLADLPRPSKPTARFRRGDANGNGHVEMADAVFILGWKFLGSAEPGCQDAADVNDDGVVNVGDPVYLLGWLFRGGPMPPSPGPIACGGDPTADRLPVCEYAICKLSF
jgi:hypothetical protein